MKHLGLELSENQKPRERFILYGGDALTDAELLAILLQVGTKKYNVYILAQMLIAKYGSLSSIFEQSVEELMQNEGIGPTKAIKIKALYFLSKKITYQETKKYKITKAQDIFEYVKEIGYKEEENLYVLCLKNNNEVIALKHIFKGNINSVMISPREIFKEALTLNSNKICLIHNHPSGDITPSVADIKSTELLIEGSMLVGVNILDHLIIGKEKYYSLRENKLVDFRNL
ncbi:MAG: RadC family protein [Mycoplasmatales bacterium]